PLKVERLGAGVSVRVPVCRGQADDDLLTGRDLHTSESQRRSGIPKRRMGHRSVVAKELLDCLGNPSGIGAKLGKLEWIAEQSHHAVADEAGGGVVSG